MKKTTFVALLVLSFQCMAENLDDSLQRIESEWAQIHYQMPNHQETAFDKLLEKTVKLSKQYPKNAEPIIWTAIIKATNAENQNAVSALEAIHDARDLLLEAIKINPSALGGSAQVTLGALYYLTPKWPIGYGDEQTAKEMLETALRINPQGIESNYFYGDFLLSRNAFNEAETHFQRALAARSRPEQLLADSQIKELAKIGLQNAMKMKLNMTKSTFASLIDSNLTK